MDVIGWLLEGDPAIRWQVLRDLVSAPAGDVAAEEGVGTPSRWNTLRALRVLEWWDGIA